MIKCACGFEDLPENFHASYRFDEEEQQNIYIICPKCGEWMFFQHFKINKEYPNGFSLSHLLNAPFNEKYPTWEEAMQYTNDQIKIRGFKPVLEIIGEKKNVNTNRN
jgi:hypothetical protein